ncbi:hypothetical protein AXK56_16620 [Tsukamurella pulmonis]|uniref:hypothetical protein n=1 Tax=Tsukamurella pulmonis TaxID=47312 RepID=UPI0007938946|nr:hypothetical protein [Tsukamurella pulmonis]KXO95833.1 hypothetical protein AXK56_16620 [Tsukamurella pulmonis]
MSKTSDEHRGVAALATPAETERWVRDRVTTYAKRAVPATYVRIMVSALPDRRTGFPTQPRKRWWSRQKAAPEASTQSRWDVAAASLTGVPQALAATVIDVIADIAGSSAWKAAELDQQRVRIDLAVERFHVLSQCADLYHLAQMGGGEVDVRDASEATVMLQAAVAERQEDYEVAEAAVIERVAALRSYHLGLVQIEALLANRDVAVQLTSSAHAAEDLRDQITAIAQVRSSEDAPATASTPAVDLEGLDANLQGQLEYLAQLISRPSGTPLHTTPLAALA